MNEPKMTTLAPKRLSLMSVIHLDREQGIVTSCRIVCGPGSEFLISRHQGRRDVVGHQVRVRVDMQELDDIVLTDNSTSTGFWDFLGRDDLPVVVGIIMRVCSDLLACARVLK